MSTKYFTFDRVTSSFDSMSNTHSKWVFVPFILAVNGICSTTPNKTNDPGTDVVLDGFTLGDQIGVRSGDGREVRLRPFFSELKRENQSDYLNITLQKLWANGLSSRGYRDMRQQNLLKNETDGDVINESFWNQMTANLQHFSFEHFLVYFFAFKGIPREIDSWDSLEDYFWSLFPNRSTDLPKFQASGFGVKGTVPWPEDFLESRPTNSEYQSALLPSLQAGQIDPSTLTTADFESELRKAISDHSLVFSNNRIVRQLDVAIRSGKHLILVGPPGCGKTTLAEAITTAAHRCGMSNSSVTTTASSDWSTAETIGTYRLTESNTLKYEPGIVVEAILNRDWLIIDELNRADIDRAFGPLMTVLSGHQTVLRFIDPNGSGKRLAIVPEGQNCSDEVAPFIVFGDWRIVATMNSADQDLLFELSQALLRRFAIVNIPIPTQQDHVSILGRLVELTPPVELLLSRLVSIPDCPLGPGITTDIARYVSESTLTESDLSEIIPEVVDMYISPQLPNYSNSERQRIISFLRSGDERSIEWE